MAKEENALIYSPVNAQKKVSEDEFLKRASENVFLWEESDKEMAQGRTNFQIEKFIGLNTHNISVSFEHILKERRIMAGGYMSKIIEMKEVLESHSCPDRNPFCEHCAYLEEGAKLIN